MLIHIMFAEIPKSYSPFVDREDGYSYYYPSDWRVGNGFVSIFVERMKHK